MRTPGWPSIMLLAAACHTDQPEDAAPAADTAPDECLSPDDWYVDGDLDGFGGDADVIASCERQTGRTLIGGDCDDADAAIHPEAFDYSGDGVDNDCDGHARCEEPRTTVSEDIDYSSISDFDDWCAARRDVLLDGDLRIQMNLEDASDQLSLDCLCEIAGDVAVIGDVFALDGLDGLLAIGGDLEVSDNDLLDRVSLRSLRTIGGSLDLHGLGALRTTSDLESLESVGGSVAITGNDLLQDVHALARITEVRGGLDLSGNALLADLSGVAGVQSVDGLLRAEDLPLLTDFTALAALTTVGGGLELGCGRCADLGGFTGLTTFGNELRITDSPHMVAIAMPALAEPLTGTLWISASPALEDLDALGIESELAGLYLEGASSIYGLELLAVVDGFQLVDHAAADLTGLNLASLVEIRDSARIHASEELESLAGLEALTEAGTLDITANPALTGLSGLDNLRHLDDWGTISDNAALLTTSGLSTLESLDGLRIERNDGLLAVEGFDSLALTEFGLTISGNGALERIDLSTDARNPGVGLEVLENGALLVLNGDDETRAWGSIIVEDNPSLQRITGWSEVETSYELSLIDNPALATIEAFARLRQVESLEISGNDLLAEVGPLDSLLHVTQDLTITGNLALTDITALFGLISVGGTLEISDNPFLPAEQADALVDAIGELNIGGAIIVEHNGP